MKPEFEEKTYETAFNAELMRRTNLFFAPGQCAEGYLGFDFVAYLDDPYLWEFYPYWRRRRISRRTIGVPLNEVARGMAKVAKEVERHLPKFSGNVFIQYKRAHYLNRSNAREWDHWRDPYYRFEINKKQQQLLLALSANASGRAAVVYAAPVFWNMDTLFRHQRKATIISNSNISSVGHIGHGHDHFTYKQAGNLGKAFSEPKDIESPSFESILGQQKEGKASDFRQHVKTLASELESAVTNAKWVSSIWENARIAALSRFDGESSVDEVLDRGEGSFLSAIITLTAFTQITGTSLFLVAAGDEG